MDKTIAWTHAELDVINLVAFSQAGKIGEFTITDSAIIGRKTKTSTADIMINSPLVSRQHGRIYKSNGKFFYEDLESLNGTFINERFYGKDSKDKKMKALLSDGDVVRIDHSDLDDPLQDAVVFIVKQKINKKYVHKKLAMDEINEFRIGRKSGGSGFENQMVSSQHAIFRREGSQWSIADLNSTNGVYLNNIRITGKSNLTSLDVVRIVDYYFVYTSKYLYYFCEPEVHNSLIISIAEKNVWQMFKKHTLLKDINLAIPEGSMVMILGGSGAGKTTFVNAVMGYEKAKGEIIHNNVNVYKEYDKMKHVIGFVPQQDLLRLEDTVYKTLDNAAEMKLPVGTSKYTRDKRIMEVLDSLGLTREKDSTVRKLSGGQRKRLSIAVELISDPKLFFLDEPDSGLDGIMAKSLMEQLRIIADQKRIVMVITHAPDRVRDLFDKVLVLAKGEKDNVGHMAFWGSPDEALAFFETDSLEGVVKRINRKDEGGDGKSDFYINKFAGTMNERKK